MQLFHNFHNNNIYKFFHSDLWLFELSVWLHTFSRALIGIFIPILLLKIGYTVGEVIIYYFLYNLFDVPLNFLVRDLITKIGARLVVIIGSIFSLAYFAILLSLTLENWPLIIALSLFAALYDTFYWIAHLFIFYEYNKRHATNTSKNTSTLYILRTIAGLLAPIIGAWILIYSNQKVLILLSIAILTISTWPLFKIKILKDMPQIKKTSTKQFFKNKRVFRQYLAKGMCSFSSSADTIIWPIFIFLIFDSIKSVAYLSIIASFTTMTLTYFVGTLKKENKKITIIAGGIALSLVWILRIFIENQALYYFSALLIGAFSVLVHIPIDMSITKLSKQKNALSASTYRNIFDMSANLILYGVLALLINVFHISFVIAASSTLIIVILVSTINSRYL